MNNLEELENLFKDKVKIRITSERNDDESNIIGGRLEIVFKKNTTFFQHTFNIENTRISCGVRELYSLFSTYDLFFIKEKLKPRMFNKFFKLLL